MTNHSLIKWSLLLALVSCAPKEQMSDLAATASHPIVRLRPLNSYKAITVDGWYTHNGARLLQWDYDSQSPNHQRFYQIASSDGSVTFKSVHSNKCFSVDWSGVSGTDVIQWDCSFHPNQRFSVQTLADGSKIYKSKSSGLCLNLKNGDQYNGVPLQQYSCNGSRAQRFVNEAGNVPSIYLPSSGTNLAGGVFTAPSSAPTRNSGFAAVSNPDRIYHKRVIIQMHYICTHNCLRRVVEYFPGGTKEHGQIDAINGQVVVNVSTVEGEHSFWIGDPGQWNGQYTKRFYYKP